jgi:hypothetical protein
MDQGSCISVSKLLCFFLVLMSPVIALRPTLFGYATHTPGFFSPPPPRRICEALILIVGGRNANGPDGEMCGFVGNGFVEGEEVVGSL